MGPGPALYASDPLPAISRITVDLMLSLIYDYHLDEETIDTVQACYFISFSV